MVIKNKNLSNNSSYINLNFSSCYIHTEKTLINFKITKIKTSNFIFDELNCEINKALVLIATFVKLLLFFLLCMLCFLKHYYYKYYKFKKLKTKELFTRFLIFEIFIIT